MFGIRTVRAFVNSTTLPDRVVRLRERKRGIRYPERLIGRQNWPPSQRLRCDVLVVAAHPDDEVLGLGLTMIKHRASREVVTVVFATNGAGGNWRESNDNQRALAALRLGEARDALAVIGIGPENIICLGFPDAGLHRYMREADRDISVLVEACRPATVYVHAMEGGHEDHDVTGFLVQRIADRVGLDNVLEWVEYSREAQPGRPASEPRFAYDPYVQDFLIVHPPSDEPILAIKQEMLAKYVSQAHAIESYPFRGEILRRAKPIHLLPRLAYFTRFSKRRLSGLARCA